MKEKRTSAAAQIRRIGRHKGILPGIPTSTEAQIRRIGRHKGILSGIPTSLGDVVLTIKPIRAVRWSRAVKRFIREQAAQGNALSEQTAPEMLVGVETLVIDAPLIMEGWNAVRMAAAPLALRSIDQFKRQGSWMMLTAGVALGCDGYKPLEDFAREMNFEHARLSKQYSKVDEIPYDGDRKIESTIHRDANGLRAFAKGDPASILARCEQVLDGRERPMLYEDKERALESALKMEGYGLETLAFATKRLEGPGDFEREMVFLGVVGMGDIAREEIPGVMDAFRGMGMRPVLVSDATMVEGAARASGAMRYEAGILGGAEMDEMDDRALVAAVKRTDAFVELNPMQRGRVIRALRAIGPVAILSEAPDGGIGLSLRRNGGEAPDTALVHGGLDEVVRLFADCHALYEEHNPEETE